MIWKKNKIRSVKKSRTNVPKYSSSLGTELLEYRKKHRNAVAYDEGGFEVNLKELNESLEDLDHLNNNQSVVRNPDAMVLVGAFSPESCSAILKDGSWGNGNEFSKKEKKALEFISGIEHRDRGKVMIYPTEKQSLHGEGAYPDMIVLWQE